MSQASVKHQIHTELLVLTKTSLGVMEEVWFAQTYFSGQLQQYMALCNKNADAFQKVSFES